MKKKEEEQKGMSVDFERTFTYDPLVNPVSFIVVPDLEGGESNVHDTGRFLIVMQIFENPNEIEKSNNLKKGIFGNKKEEKAKKHFDIYDSEKNPPINEIVLKKLSPNIKTPQLNNYNSYAVTIGRILRTMSNTINSYVINGNDDIDIIKIMDNISEALDTYAKLNDEVDIKTDTNAHITPFISKNTKDGDVFDKTFSNDSSKKRKAHYYDLIKDRTVEKGSAIPKVLHFEKSLKRSFSDEKEYTQLEEYKEKSLGESLKKDVYSPDEIIYYSHKKDDTEPEISKDIE